MAFFGSFGKKDSGDTQKASSSGRWQVGDKIANRYEIHQILRGGMGIVYICYDYEFKESVALKTFKDVYLEIPELIKSFRVEAETWIRLGSHENIVTAKFIDFIDYKPYIVLEYIGGDERYGANLSGWIEKKGLNQSLSLNFGIQFCEGMNYARGKFRQWGKDFVHRDIKPSNILVTKEKVVKVTDFGLTDIFDDKSKSVCGTLLYMSPEHITMPEKVDTRSDTFSFGVVLYEMFTGKLPFYPKFSVPQLDMFNLYLNTCLNKIPEKPSKINSSIYPMLDGVVMKCLQKKPEDRYQSFEELKKELIKIRDTF